MNRKYIKPDISSEMKTDNGTPPWLYLIRTQCSIIITGLIFEVQTTQTTKSIRSLEDSELRFLSFNISYSRLSADNTGQQFIDFWKHGRPH